MIWYNQGCCYLLQQQQGSESTEVIDTPVPTTTPEVENVPTKTPTVTIEEDKKEPKTKKKAIKKTSLSSRSKSSKLGKSNANVEVENKEMENVVANSAPDTENPSESAAKEQIVEDVNVENAEPKVDEVEAPKDPMAPSDDVPLQEPKVVCFIKICSIISIYLNN